MILKFSGEIWYWKGPAPHYFVWVPEPEAKQIKEIERLVTYGWGMIPARVTIGDSEWETALWPKDGSYIVPLKLAIRKKEKLNEGDVITVHLNIDA